MILEKSELTAGGCCNEPVEIIGKTKANFQIKDKKFKTLAYVVKNLAADMLLGIDFLMKNRARIDFHDNILEFGFNHNKITLKIDDEWISNIKGNILYLKNNEIVAKEMTNIPPNSSKEYFVTELTEKKCEIVPLVHFVTKYGLHVQKSNDSDNRIKICNRTKSAKKLYPGQRIARVNEIELESNTTSTITYVFNFTTEFKKIKPGTTINLINKPVKNNNCEKGKDPNELYDAEGEKIDINPNLSNEQKEKIKNVIRNYLDQFTSNPLNVGKAKVDPYPIVTSDNKPVFTRGYKLAPIERREMKKIINDMVKAKILRKSTSSYASPAFLKRKQDKTFRFLCNFQKLNEKIMIDRNSVPRTENIFSALEGAKFFTTLDANQGFFQIPLRKKDQHITAIIVDNELYEFTVLPQGLKNSPAAFSSVVNSALSDILYAGAVAYMDDICTYGKTFEEALENLKKTLERLKKLNLKLKTKKCHFFYEKAKLLGHEINGGKITTTNKNIEKIMKFKRPETVKQVKSFVGLCSYYRKFIKNFATISAPLSDLTKGDPKSNTKVKWNDKAEESFNKLKECLCTAPVLSLYKENSETIVEIDASSTGIGGVLYQINEKNEKHPIAFYSKKLQERQKKYAAYDLEMTALVETLLHFREYLYGIKFTVYTDHMALTHYRNMKEPSARLARLVQKLSDFDFVIKHKKGKENIVPDTLSRTIIENINEKTDLKIEQMKDDFCREMIETKKGKSTKLEKKSRNYLIDDNGILQYKVRTPQGLKKLLVIPKQLTRKIMEKLHDSAVGGGHFGLYKTIGKISERYYWERMRRDVEKYIKSCEECQKNKKQRGKKQGFLKPIEINDPSILSHLELDFVGPLNPSDGKKYILVGSCRSTKHAFAKPVASADGNAVIKFIDQLITTYGCPKKITTDRGTHFKNKELEENCKALGIELRFSTAYSPQTQGGVERFNKTLIETLNAYVAENPKDWAKYVPFVVFSYNASPMESLKGLSPFYLMFGQSPNLPSPLTYQSNDKESRIDKINKLIKIRESIPKLIEKSNEKMKARYDRNRINVHYEPGEKVLIENPQKQGKFHKKYLGPYEIKSKLSNENYVIEQLVRGKPSNEIVHVRRLRKFIERN